ncbi:MAG: methyl-accepting chemotaxis protein, partial [Bacillus sp. (in: firmicutes)]
GLYVASLISNPLKNLGNVANRMADGDLDVDISFQSKDEVGELARAFKKMSENLNDVIANIHSAAEQVSSGSKQVSDSSVELAQGATEQASSIEQFTASIEEISSQTNNNAKNAIAANEIASSAKMDAERGNERMIKMLGSMEDINESSSNISKIIKVIDEIAFQTNILALNAAVEAARAGQHGKGFAVVAEEVRNLAARSADAAKETTDLIEGSIKKVEDGTKIATETANALNKIVVEITKVASLVGDIAVASNEQASGIGQVNQGILQVSQVIQANSATAEESAAASEELSSQAELLNNMVRRFKLKRGRTAHAGDGISPAVLKLIENMGEKEFNQTSYHKEKYSTDGSIHSIDLSDKEFGKY